MGKNHIKLLNNLEQLRKSCGLTQQELSVRAEVSRKSINAIENGVYVPSTVLALKISNTLNCSVEDLFMLPKWLSTKVENKINASYINRMALFVSNVKKSYLLWEPSQNPSRFWVFPHPHLGLSDIITIFIL